MESHTKQSDNSNNNSNDKIENSSCSDNATKTSPNNNIVIMNNTKDLIMNNEKKEEEPSSKETSKTKVYCRKRHNHSTFRLRLLVTTCAIGIILIVVYLTYIFADGNNNNDGKVELNSISSSVSSSGPFRGSTTSRVVTSNENDGKSDYNADNDNVDNSSNNLDDHDDDNDDEYAEEFLMCNDDEDYMDYWFQLNTYKYNDDGDEVVQSSSSSLFYSSFCGDCYEDGIQCDDFDIFKILDLYGNNQKYTCAKCCNGHHHHYKSSSNTKSITNICGPSNNDNFNNIIEITSQQQCLEPNSKCNQLDNTSSTSTISTSCKQCCNKKYYCGTHGVSTTQISDVTEVCTCQ